MGQLRSRLVILTFLISITGGTNYISNGGFDNPIVPPMGYQLEGAVGWSGWQYEVMNLYSTLGYGQYVDMAYTGTANGYLQQTVDLPQDGNCTLSFLQKTLNTNYPSFVMQVFWNGQLLATQMANTTATTLVVFTVFGTQGSNLIKFNEIGTRADGNGMFLDEVILDCVYPNVTQTQNSSIVLNMQ